MKKTLAAFIAILILLTASAASARGKKDVTFNFVDVEITSVAKFVSDVTGKNFIFDDKVRGKITIIAPSKLTSDDAFNLFTSVLTLKGFALTPSGIDAYKIVPATEAKNSGVAMAEMPTANENFVARLMPVENISSEEALNFLRPMISKNGYISSFGPGNLILIVDSGLNVDKIMELVEAIDQPTSSEEPEVVYLKNASADNVAKIINEGLKRNAKGRKPEEIEKAVSDSRLNAVVLFGSRGAKESMKRLIAMLDVEARQEQGVINVYFLENATAEDLATVLKEIVQKKAAKPGEPTPFTLENISVTADKATNALIIVASPSDYANITAVIKQLDRRRRQVFVEAMIVEANIDKLRELGSNWRLTGQSNGEPVVIGGVGTVNSDTMETILSGMSGLTIGGMSDFMTVPVTDSSGETTELSVPGFAALFSMSEFQGVVNVLSSPQILTSDNTEAEIVVGENVPFITKWEGDSSGDNITSSVERKDVGISLKITPQITQGDYVKLDIYQEISAVQESSTEIYTSVGPTTTKRSTKTNVIARDRQTVAIGGLMQEGVEESEMRVPFLHRIPILGWLFKYKSTAKTKTNLLVFLTPHIIRENEDIDTITEAKYNDFANRQIIYADGELIVKFRPSVPDAEARKIIAEEGAKVIKLLSPDGLYHLYINPDISVMDAVDDFSDLKQVEYAEPNYIMKSLSEDMGRMPR